jgi:hypothetical protein
MVKKKKRSKVEKMSPVVEWVEIVLRTVYETLITASPIAVMIGLHELLRFLDGSRTMMPILMGYCVVIFLIKSVYYLPVLLVTFRFKWYSFVQYVAHLGLYGTTFAIALQAYQTGDIISVQLLSPVFFLVAHHVLRMVHQQITR